VIEGMASYAEAKKHVATKYIKSVDSSKPDEKIEL
jgi:hypothetical protein